MENNKDIDEFRNKFREYFHKRVVPELGLFEKTRKQRLFRLTVLTLVTGIILICLLFYITKINPVITWVIVAALLVIFPYLFDTIKGNFEKGIKNKIMPVLMNAFGDFHWSQELIISESTVKDSLLIGNRFDIKRDDDCFYGTYKGVKFIINETELAYERMDSKGNTHEQTVFDGLLIQLQMNKPFTNHTVILKHLQTKFPPGRLDYVALEDPLFEKYFDVYSTDQVEARYLLTTAFMERFKNLITVFKTKAIKCSFKDNKILLALDLRRDLFRLGSMTMPVTDTRQYKEMFSQIAGIFEMIDVLKLDMKIGL